MIHVDPLYGISVAMAAGHALYSTVGQRVIRNIIFSKRAGGRSYRVSDIVNFRQYKLH